MSQSVVQMSGKFLYKMLPIVAGGLFQKGTLPSVIGLRVNQRETSGASPGRGASDFHRANQISVAANS
jgi:hypothetical protein